MSTSSTGEPAARGGFGRAVRFLQIVDLGLGATLVVLALWVVVARFLFPIDGEWMTGAVRDGVDRVKSGQQLYAAPSAHFVPFVYTPMYFWVSALVARVCSTFVACKLVSIAASIVTGWGIFRISRVLGASTFWCVMGLALHVASYSFTLFFFDVERVDAFSAAVVVIGVATLLSRPSLAYTAAAGAILGAAFFAKQPGLLAFVAAVVGLALAGERKRALVAGGVGALVFVALGVFLEVRTGGWFRYYCLKLPQSHGLKPELLSTFLIVDVPKTFAIAAGSVAVIAPVAWSFVRHRKAPEGATWKDVTFGAVVAAGMAGAFFLRAHLGGWQNVLVAWLPLGCAATAVAASRAEAWAKETTVRPLVQMMLLGGIALQLLGATFDPNEVSPNHHDFEERVRFVQLVHKLEAEGEVIITTTGHVTKPSSVHAAALFDIVRAGDHAPKDLLEGLEARRYSALLVGAPGEFICPIHTCEELVTTMARHYFVAGRRHERERNGMSGFDARPRWLMRPRKNPLPPMETKALFLLQHIEMGFAEMESSKSPLEEEIEPADEIEERAAREVQAMISHDAK